MVILHSSTPDRYPLNPTSAMVINVLVAYGFYLILAFFPKVWSLGSGLKLFGILQLVIHSITINLKLRTIYNPGLDAVVFLHIPIGIYYIYYIHSTGIASVGDWMIGLVYIFFVAILEYKVTFTWSADKNSSFVLSDTGMRRSNVQEKIERLNDGTLISHLRSQKVTILNQLTRQRNDLSSRNSHHTSMIRMLISFFKTALANSFRQTISGRRAE